MNDPVNKQSSAKPAGSARAANSPGLLGQHLAGNFYPHFNTNSMLVIAKIHINRLKRKYLH